MLRGKGIENMRLTGFAETLLNDLRYGLRMLARRPGLTIVAIITFALGVGANTVIFSGVYALLLESPPYPNAERLVILSQAPKEGVESGVSYVDFLEWQQNTSFERMAVYRNVSLNLTDNDLVERVTGSLVSEEFFALLSGPSLPGQMFSEADYTRGSKTIILNYGFWKRQFGAEPDVIGRNLRLNNESYTIVGVMPESFQFPFRSQFWIPLESFERAETLQNRAANYYQILALLKTEVTVDLAASEINLMIERSRQSRLSDRQPFMAKVTGLRESMPGIVKYRTPLLVLQFAVVFVLLIASVNLANLLVARNTERRQEFTIRLAIGAARLRLIRQLLTESLMLGFAGSLLGLLLAWWGIGALRAALPARIPTLGEVGINFPVLIFTLSVSLITSLGFGLFPALAASGMRINESLKAGALGVSTDLGRRRLSKGLMIAEVTLAVVLLAGAGLMVRTFLNLTAEDPGFDFRRAIALSLALPPAEYPTDESVSIYFNEAIRKLSSVQGVESVGAVTYLPLIGYNPGTDFAIEGRARVSTEPALRADFQPVTPAYFDSIAIPLLRGRLFNEGDMKQAPEVVIINNALAKRFWPDEDPIGKHIELLGNNALPNSLVIAGIVGDVKQFGLHTEPRPEIYIPKHRSSMTLIIRTTSSPASVMAAIREAVQEIDRDKAAFSLRTLDQVVENSLDSRRIFVWLLGVLSAVALLLAVMGIYGVVSNLVSQRTREIGIRMALGAMPRDIVIEVLRQGTGLVAIGILLGIIASIALTRFMKSMLFGVSVIDPITFAFIIVILTTTSLLACLVPARRASRVDPLIALRQE